MNNSMLRIRQNIQILSRAIQRIVKLKTNEHFYDVKGFFLDFNLLKRCFLFPQTFRLAAKHFCNFSIENFSHLKGKTWSATRKAKMQLVKSYWVVNAKMTLKSNVLFNSTIEENWSSKIFEGLFEPRTSKVIFLLLSFILTLTSMVLSYGIIWYERFGTDQVIRVEIYMVEKVASSIFVLSEI